MDPRTLVARIEDRLGSTPTGASPPGTTPPPRVADHELVRCIGAGSYGEVWLARSITGQWRAVKVIARARFESERPFEREFRGVVQFEPISRSHSGLIHVLHVGRDDQAGAFYYVMELADDEEGRRPAPAGPAPPSAAPAGGQPSVETSDPFSTLYHPRTLRSDLRARGRLPVADVVAVGVQLCGALGHLHRHGLLHRDVKPSNVIYVEGQPKLADLGLVATTTEARSFVGTEGFIPPEGPGTPKADLFALGRLLYEAATGKDRCEFPELPPDLDTWPDRDAFLELNEVLSRLCAPEPHRRCANAADVAVDLNLLLAGRSVRRIYGVERRLRRATVFSAVTLGILVLAAAVVGLQEQRRRRTAARATEERALRERAEVAERTARSQLYSALLEQARATVRSGELGQRFRALEAIRRAATIRNTAELRREAIAALGLPDLRFDRTLPMNATLTARELDPAFERIAVVRGRGPVELRSTTDDRLLATLPPSTNLPCYTVGWSDDGRFLAVKRDHDGYGRVADFEVWQTRPDARLVLRVSRATLNARAFHPQRPRFLTADEAGRIVTWDLADGTEVGRVRWTAESPGWLAFSRDGHRLASIHARGRDSIVAVHDAADGALRSSRAFPATITTVAWHPAGKWLAVPDYAGNVHLLSPETGDLRTLGRHRAEAVTAVFDRTGNYLFTGGWERSLVCWDLRTFGKAFIVELDSYQLQMRTDGRACALLTPSGVDLHGFDLPLQRQFAEDLGSRLRLAAFSPDGRWIAAAADQRLGVWDLWNEGPAALTEEGAEASPFWLPDGRELFGSRRDEYARRWRVTPAARSGEPPVLEPMALPQPAGFTSLCLASNLVVWTTTRGTQFTEPESILPSDERWKRTAHGMNGCSPDGRWLAIYRGYTPDLYLYRRPDLEPVARLTCLGNIAGYAFSPSGDEIAVSSRGQVEFWNTRTWSRDRVLTNYSGVPHVGVLAQPDGTGWWLAREQRFASLCESANFEPRLPFPSAASPVTVSADGRRLAVSVEARRLEVWDLARVKTELWKLGLEWTEAPR